MKTKGLDKVLKNHPQHCKLHEYSLQKHRYCSCGLERARIEKEILVAGFEWILKAYEYLQTHQSVEANSFAEVELERIIERARNERITSPK